MQKLAVFIWCIVASVLLGACNLQPIYAGAASDSGVVNALSAVEVSPIAGQDGWLMRNALDDSLRAAGKTTARYRLDVRLDDQLDAFGVLRDDTITREQRILRARYQLIDLENDEILLDRTAGADAGIDVVSSEYATIAAEQTALEDLTRVVAQRIITQVSLRLRAEQ